MFISEFITPDFLTSLKKHFSMFVIFFLLNKELFGKIDFWALINQSFSILKHSTPVVSALDMYNAIIKTSPRTLIGSF